MHILGYSKYNEAFAFSNGKYTKENFPSKQKEVPKRGALGTAWNLQTINNPRQKSHHKKGHADKT
jgi:hypothetical protein